MRPTWGPFGRACRGLHRPAAPTTSIPLLWHCVPYFTHHTPTSSPPQGTLLPAARLPPLLVGPHRARVIPAVARGPPLPGSPRRAASPPPPPRRQPTRKELWRRRQGARRGADCGGMEGGGGRVDGPAAGCDEVAGVERASGGPPAGAGGGDDAQGLARGQRPGGLFFILF